jgi:hypothetical protein
MGASTQVMLMTIVLIGALGVIGVLGIKAAVYVVKGLFKNEKING